MSNTQFECYVIKDQLYLTLDDPGQGTEYNSGAFVGYELSLEEVRELKSLCDQVIFKASITPKQER